MLVLLQVVALSDVFTEKQQHEWMLDVLLEVHKTHPIDDELVNQYLVVGICKAAAIVGMVRRKLIAAIRIISSHLAPNACSNNASLILPFFLVSGYFLI